MTATRQPTFRPTAAATAKANPHTFKADPRNIFDFSYLIDCINSLDFSDYNHINLCAEYLTDRISGSTTEFNDGFTSFTINLYPFKIYIDTIPQTYCIYTSDGRQKYKYHYYDTLRITIYHYTKEAPVFYQAFNDHRYLSFKHYIEIDL